MNKIDKEVLSKVDEMFFYSFAFVFPLFQKLSTVILLLWCIFSIVFFNRNLLVNNRYLLIPVTLYLIYLLSFVWTNNQFALKLVEMKASLFVFPMIFFFRGDSVMKHYKKGLHFFVFGCASAVVFCILVAVFQSFSWVNDSLVFKANIREGFSFFDSIVQGGNYFFGSFFSIFHQTVYFASYVLVALTLLTYLPLKKKVFNISLTLLFILALILISNRANTIIFVLLAFFFFTNRLKGLGNKLVAFLLLIGLMVTIARLNPRLRSLANEVSSGFVIDAEARYGSATRLLNWHGSYLAIKDNWVTGAGPVDAQKQLNAKYKELGYIWPLKNQFNSHNMFLQIWLDTGIFGFLVLIFSFFMIAFKLFRLKNKTLRPLLISLLFLIFLNFLFESFFHRYSGISFYSFIYCLIVMMMYNEEKQNNIKSNSLK